MYAVPTCSELHTTWVAAQIVEVVLVDEMPGRIISNPHNSRGKGPHALGVAPLCA